MLKFLKIIGGIALFIFSLFIALYLFQPDPWVYSSSKKSQIRYNGKINFEGYEKLVKVYDEAKKKPTKLEITSYGGSGLAGMLIGRFVKEKNLDVQVRRHCISSCANYVFPAGNHKRLYADALVIYHGGLFQENLFDKLMASHQAKQTGKVYKDVNAGKEGKLFKNTKLETKLQRKYFPDDGACKKPVGDVDAEAIAESARRCLEFRRNIEREFYALLNVDPMLPYYGHKGDYEATYQAYKHIGFYYDLASLEELGVSNVEVIDGNWHPTENRHFEKVYKVTHRGISVVR